MRAQGIYGISQKAKGIKDIISHYRLHNIELELTVFHAKGNSQIVGNYLVASLVHNLGDNRIYLAGHNGGAGLTRRQSNLAEACTRAGGHQAQVIGNLNQRESRNL